MRRAVLMRCAKPAPNLSHQHRIVSYVTVTPRSKSSSSMSRRLNWKRKIPSNSAADDTSRETVPVIKRFRFFHRAILRDRPNNLTMPPRGSCTTLRWEKALQASPETLLRQNFCPNWLLECDPFVHLKAGPSLRGRSLGCPPACGVDPYQRTHRTMTSRSK